MDTGIKVFVRTDKPSYLGGEVITGYLCISNPYPVLTRACLVRIKGFEKGSGLFVFCLFFCLYLFLFFVFFCFWFKDS